MDASLRQQVREPNALIGGRIRAGRGLRGWSQEALGDALGITFQQVQKYENGKNRVAACTLISIANALELDVSFFLPGGAAPLGLGEVEAIRADVDGCLEAVGLTLDALGALRERMEATAARLREAEQAGRAV